MSTLITDHLRFLESSKLILQLQVMSERCAFLSTISTTLAAISKTSQLPSLQKKLMMIQENSTTQNTETQSPRLNQTIQAHLFRMMHTSLHEPISGRRLQPSMVEQSGEYTVSTEPPSQAYGDGERPHVSISETTGNEEENFEDMLGEELLSDDEIDMLFDLEILRNQEKGCPGGSCSMLMESEGGNCSMLLENEKSHEGAAGEIGEEDRIFSTRGIKRGDQDEHTLEERDVWSSSIMEEALEDTEMIMDTSQHVDHGYGSLYLDGLYVNNDAILI
jgi:hypothetical protein